MGYVVVLVLAGAVGVGVYVYTARGSDILGQRRGGVVASPAGGLLKGVHNDWQTRVTGIVGLAIAVILAAVVLAAAVYAVGSAIGNAVGDAATNGGVTNERSAP